MLPFCWGRVYGLGKKHPGKVYHFVQVYLPLREGQKLISDQYIFADQMGKFPKF